MERQVYERMAGLEGRHWWFVARRRILAAALARLSPLPPGGRLLEAGCGTGGNLAMLRRHGTVSAFEPDQAARARAATHTGVEIRDGRLPDDVPFAAGAFDLVVALDVVEHVQDDLAALRALAARLRPGGRLLVTVPASPFLWGRHDEVHHHFRRYRRAELVSLLGEAGLRPVYVSGFNTLLFPLVVAARMVRKAFRIEGDEDAMPPGMVNRLLCGIFSSERHLIGRLSLPFGVSLLAVAESMAVE